MLEEYELDSCINYANDYAIWYILLSFGITFKICSVFRNAAGHTDNSRMLSTTTPTTARCCCSEQRETPPDAETFASLWSRSPRQDDTTTATARRHYSRSRFNVNARDGLGMPYAESTSWLWSPRHASSSHRERNGAYMPYAHMYNYCVVCRVLCVPSRLKVVSFRAPPAAAATNILERCSRELLLLGRSSWQLAARTILPLVWRARVVFLLVFSFLLRVFLFVCWWSSASQYVHRLYYSLLFLIANAGCTLHTRDAFARSNGTIRCRKISCEKAYIFRLYNILFQPSWPGVPYVDACHSVCLVNCVVLNILSNLKMANIKFSLCSICYRHMLFIIVHNWMCLHCNIKTVSRARSSLTFVCLGERRGCSTILSTIVCFCDSTSVVIAIYVAWFVWN